RVSISGPFLIKPFSKKWDARACDRGWVLQNRHGQRPPFVTPLLSRTSSGEETRNLKKVRFSTHSQKGGGTVQTPSRPVRVRGLTPRRLVRVRNPVKRNVRPPQHCMILFEDNH